jgi:hypothetical protein
MSELNNIGLPIPEQVITYSVSASGIILEVSEPSWSQFAGANQGGAVNAAAVVGRPLYDFISGSEVVASYRVFHDLLLKGLVPEVSFTCQCDAPEVRRLHHIKIERSAIHSSPVLRYTSSILGESKRTPVALLQKEDRGSNGETILKVCSYCLKVNVPPGAVKGLWIAMESYEENGGATDVAISHGICQDCRSAIVEPMIARLDQQKGRR